MINAEKNRINKVLSNEEIQAIITAIGTGIGEEFDISKLRYHRVIVMTDADVDGAHIRTLILTFLYRQMQELVERGHVYIAVAPLYRVKIGNQQRYVEKESQLEDLLVRERVKDMDVTDRAGETQKLTEARYGRFVRVLHEFDGWVSRLREDFGAGGGQLRRSTTGIVETEAVAGAIGDALGDARAERLRALGALDRRGRRRCSGSSSARRARRRASSFRPSCSRPRSTRTCGRRTRAWPRSSGSRRSRSRSARRRARAETFGQLREQALELAKEGIQVSRFKGLGEMDAEELAETTMNPANRMLIRVDVEDAAAADRVFSTLMGDQVEPRRAFIEQNAREVRFLDV